MTAPVASGTEGWDAYAPFYDWENAQTVARRDVAFWQRLAMANDGPVLELGCGTGRVSLPVVRVGARLVGVDLSIPMLTRARQRLARSRLSSRALLVRADIRQLPFGSRNGFGLAMAPYGILQSLTRERDLKATLESVHRVMRPGGLFGIDLVPDLPRWSEYQRRTSLQGRRGREDDRDPHRVGAPGPPAQADDFRSGVRRAPRHRAIGAPFLPDVPHAFGASDGQAAGSRRVFNRGDSRRLSGWTVG